MENNDELGVLIDEGAQDWQIFQRNEQGTASIRLRGRWTTPVKYHRAAVCVRLVREEDGEAVGRGLDWVRATTRRNGTWSVRLEDVPQGGLYRLESALQLDGGPVEGGRRGDMVHHLGVGDIWIIAGQSNAEGHGKSPVPDPPMLGVHMFHARGRWALASHPLGDSTQTRYSPNRLASNPSHSPWLTFGKVLLAQLGVPIGLIPASLGGSSLANWTRGVDGLLFRNMLRYLRDAGGFARGMVWYQGESDATPELSRVYARHFRRFVADLRRSLGNPRLPVITTQLNRCVAADPERDQGFEAIRQVQRQLAAKMRDVYLLSTLDLSISDVIHTSSAGNVVIGQRAAAAVLGGVFGRDVKYRHPNCTTAQRRGARRIELQFEDVDERLQYDNNLPAEFAFDVRDRVGSVPVEGWAVVGGNRLQIRLARPLVGRAVVVGGPTAFPSSVVPQDVGGHRPMLGFTQPVSP